MKKKILALALTGAMLASVPVYAESKTDTLIKAEDPSKNPQEALDRKDTIIEGITDFAGVFNPLWSQTKEDMEVNYVTVSALSGANDAGEIVSETADLTISEDGKTYTYKLKDTKYNDGSDVKAQDYVNFYKVVADPTYDGFIEFTNEKIVGWDDYKKGDATEIKGIQTPDDKTIVINIEEPMYTAVYSLGAAWPISTEKYGEYIKKGDIEKFKNVDMHNFVGNGQYTLKDWKEKESILLEKNKYYFKGEPKIEKFIKKVIPVDADGEAIKTGEIDISTGLSCTEDHIEEVKADGFVDIRIQPTLGYGYVAMNHSLPIFKDPKVREAIYCAIDREGLVKSVYGDYARVLDIPQSNVSWIYDDSKAEKYTYDLDKAAKLLKEAGWENKDGKLEKDGKQMKIIFTAMKGNPVTDNLIPQMIDSLKKLGIDLQAEYVDWPTLSKKTQDGKFDMFFMAWGLTANPDCSQLYATKGKGGAQNRLNYSNEKLDELFTKALHLTDKEEFKKAYSEIYAVMSKDLPDLPIYQRCDLIIYNSRIEGFECTPYDGWYNHLYEMSIK